MTRIEWTKKDGDDKAIKNRYETVLWNEHTELTYDFPEELGRDKPIDVVYVNGYARIVVVEYEDSVNVEIYTSPQKNTG